MTYYGKCEAIVNRDHEDLDGCEECHWDTHECRDKLIIYMIAANTPMDAKDHPKPYNPPAWSERPM